MNEKFFDFDAAEYLTSPEAITQFMVDALETNDASYIIQAYTVVSRAVATNLATRITTSCSSPDN